MKVITTVGTSIYNNVSDKLDDTINNKWKTLNDKYAKYSSMGSKKGVIGTIKDAIKQIWSKDTNTSAEIRAVQSSYII